MTEKTAPAGWVVQAIIPTEPEAREADAPWRPAVMLTNAPTFAYFNVAIAASDKAIDAATAYMAKGAEAKTGEMSVVRKLSSGEVAALGLKAGELKPA
jgi:hypothetical protein